MASTAAWLIVSGFVFLVLGFVLRTVMMMRSSDAAHPTASALHGRELLRQYRRHFPRSPTPLLARWCLIGGTVLLLAGISVEAAR